MNTIFTIALGIISAVTSTEMPYNYQRENKVTLGESALAAGVIPFQPEGYMLEPKEEKEETIPETIPEMIQRYFPDDPIMLKIAQCESELFPTAKNPNSSAKGIFQIINGTWQHFKCEGDVLNAEDNIKCGVKILKGQGLAAWQESASCWLAS